MKIQFFTDGDDSVGIPGETVEIDTFDLLDGFDEEERAGFVSDIQDTLRQWMDGRIRNDYPGPEPEPFENDCSVEATP